MNNPALRGGESLGSADTVQGLMREREEEGSYIGQPRQVPQSDMCWLPIEQPLLRPGDSSCSASRRRRPSACSVAQLLASRLRRIGDRLEKGWTSGDVGCGEAAAGRRGHFRGFVFLALRVALLVLLGARRHL